MRRASFWIAAALVVIADQATKAIVRASLERGESWPDWGLPFRITYVTNTGAAFGVLQEQTAFLIVMAFVGVAAIYLYYRNPPFDHWLSGAAIGMMLGGALGNLIDRIRLGRVTDFIDFDHYPAFNVADSSIFLGVAAVIIGFMIWGERQPGPPNQGPDAEIPPDR